MERNKRLTNMTIKAFVFDAYGTLYDVQSVSAITDKAFPGYGNYITQVWRMKQLEYTWLRSLMGRYKDFWAITRDSLAYTLKTIGLEPSESLFEEIAEKYNKLDPYPDAVEALQSLKGFKRAILSNGSPGMLEALTSNTGLDKYLDAVISVDSKQVFKPDPRAYELVQEKLNFTPKEIVFVSSNGFDVSGAKSFGFRVVRIERVVPLALREELTRSAIISPATMFKSLRTQIEGIGYGPDMTISSLRELSSIES